MSTDLSSDVSEVIRDIADFPKPGVLFKDITPVLQDPVLFGRIIDWFAEEHRELEIDAIVAIESRGFIFAGALVRALDAGFVPVRKSGKLPHLCESIDYELEYGHATLQIHIDAIRPGQRVLIVDDLLATGGTALAAIELVRRLGGVPVACAFVVELDFVEGRSRLDVPVTSLVHY